MAATRAPHKLHLVHPDDETRPSTDTFINVGQPERWISAVGGGTLVAYGLARRNWFGLTLAALGGSLLYRGISGHSVLYQALKRNTASPKKHAEEYPWAGNVTPLPDGKGIRVQRTLTINRNAEELYALWRDVEKAPLYMEHIKSVTSTGPRTSHWVAEEPGGKTIEWNSEVLQDEPGRLIAWHAHGQPATSNAGNVRFTPAPAGRGTQVTLEMDYFQFDNPLGRTMGKVLGRLPENEALETLRHFKALVEASEIPTIEGQPTGKGRKHGVQQ